MDPRDALAWKLSRSRRLPVGMIGRESAAERDQPASAGSIDQDRGSRVNRKQNHGGIPEDQPSSTATAPARDAV